MQGSLKERIFIQTSCCPPDNFRVALNVLQLVEFLLYLRLLSSKCFVSASAWNTSPTHSNIPEPSNQEASFTVAMLQWHVSPSMVKTSHRWSYFCVKSNLKVWKGAKKIQATKIKDEHLCLLCSLRRFTNWWCHKLSKSCCLLALFLCKRSKVIENNLRNRKK